MLASVLKVQFQVILCRTRPTDDDVHRRRNSNCTFSFENIKIFSWFPLLEHGTLYSFKHTKDTWPILCSSIYYQSVGGGLTVGLLVASAGSRSTELLGLAATRIGDQQGPVVLDQDVLDLFLGSLINICHNRIQTLRLMKKKPEIIEYFIRMSTMYNHIFGNHAVI